MMNESQGQNNHTTETVATHPSRKSEVARLQIARLTVESGLSLEDIFEATAQVTLEYLGTARVGIWLLNESRTLLKCVELREESGSQSSGAVLQLADYPAYIGALRNRKVVSAEMAQHDPLTAELLESYLKPLGITSLLDAPIYVAGEVIGVLCAEHTQNAREWSTEERDLIASMSDLLAGKIRASEVQQLRNFLELSADRIMMMEKSDALARMAFEIAHDFRNILTVVMNCAQTIGLPNTDTESMKRLIIDAAGRGSKLVKELSEFGKSEPEQSVVLNIGVELQSTLVLLQSAVGSGYKMDLQIEKPLGKILMDKNQFQRLLLNLVLNAKEAMPHGGTIDLRTIIRKKGTRDKPNWIAIEVRDHGCGMDEATMKRIFEPFFTTKENGTGLGMPIVRRIVDRAGGDIEVESQHGAGTTIRVVLPLIAH